MKSVGQIFIFSILKSFTAIVFLKLIVFPFSCFSQFKDNFSDHDFHHNPVWSGNEDAFAVINEKLQLNATPSTGSAYLSTSNGLSTGLWEFTVEMRFNPSASNYARVYLICDNDNLNAPLNGYFVMLGGTTDEVSLYRQSGMTRTRIIDGADGRLNLSAVSVTIRVERFPDGDWRLFSKLPGEPDFVKEGEVIDATFTRSSFFGVQCVYTSTRSSHFHFDDFLVESVEIADTTPPSISSIEVVSSRRVVVTFSEAVNFPENIEISAESISVERGILSADATELIVELNHALENGKSYELTIPRLSDLAGNVAENLSYTFRYLLIEDATYKDVILTELFPDPSPSVGLPEFEFVEVMNRSSKIIDLLGWTLSDGASIGRIPHHILYPGEYVILAPTNAATHYALFGNCIAVPSFPSLNNSGDRVILRNANGVMIDSVNYSDTWYRSVDKRPGGWTLELIDPENLCAEKENWTASEDENGGTPGRANSVAANNPDLTGPVLVQVIAASADSVVFLFNEKLEKNVLDHIVISFYPELAITHTTIGGGLRAICVRLVHPLSASQKYIASIEGVYDCAGNKMSTPASASFALPEEAAAGDIVLNEILFNPRPGGSDFIEIFNASAKYIDLAGWRIANCIDGVPANLRVISEKFLTIAPGEYLALTADIENIRNEYPSVQNRSFEFVNLPPFNDRSGSACLLDVNANIIDAFAYDETMHTPFLKSREGVSLERIGSKAPSMDRSNWKSASSVAGFATPGLRNSNHAESPDASNHFSIDPEAFLPVHGQPDFTMIRYSDLPPDMMGNIRILDSRGLNIKSIATNSLLGTEGFFRWDGDRDDGTRALVGAYMIVIELYNKTGLVRTARKRVAVAGRF